MTGGARGLCNPATAGTIPPYVTGYAFGRGLGFRHGRRGGYGPGIGRGRGYGRGFGWYPPVVSSAYTVNPTDELDFLKIQADEMKNSLDAINKRIETLTNKTAEES
jgi:hypothetical protein